jgi:hypothetical protein
VNDLIKDRDKCYEEFDADVPKNVKEERKKRITNDY